ncbi:hypothetical protein OZX74_05140 [Bifidobacterium sp. ESL0798]|uniref:hypothetical protein n=1 Tax=Bifidobacterium sp. ESL0798 TaxID=2983235 RepID=UPI0023FA4602|nr:hypothetical protein [Bifidobacterium sp. ESL0798]WEV73339.1 hypothetical protein OZX74_05140 [Bifidobacterium sp. ESL0798]
MVDRYEQSPGTGDVDDIESLNSASCENLRARYPQLEALASMDDEQKIEAFRAVLATLNEDLNQQQS